MSAVLSEAETKFFTSRGSDVDPSLKVTPSLPAEPAPAAPTAAPATPAAAAPSAEPAAPAAGAPPATPAAPAAPQHVPLAALHEERQKRAKAEQERQQLQQQIDELKKGQQPPAQPPDFNQDPLGALAFHANATQQQLAEFAEWRKAQDQNAQLQTARNQFTQALTASESTFRAKQPDYDQAAGFALQQYDKMLMALIPDPVQRRNQVLAEAMNAAARVMSEGRDPAEFIYSFAKNMGYAPAAPAVPPAPAAAPASVPEVVKTIERGLKQQTNLGSGGSTPPSEVTPEMALAMSPDEFNGWWAKQFRRR